VECPVNEFERVDERGFLPKRASIETKWVRVNEHNSAAFVQGFRVLLIEKPSTMEMATATTINGIDNTITTTATTLQGMSQRAQLSLHYSLSAFGRFWKT
jgi:hypothetical protein